MAPKTTKSEDRVFAPMTCFFALIAFTLMPVATMTPRALPILLGLTALAGLAAAWRHRSAPPPLPRDNWTLGLGVLSVLILTSALWSVAPSITLDKSAGTIGIFIAVLLIVSALSILPRDSICGLIRPLLSGTLLALALLTFEAATDAALYRWAHQDDLFRFPPLQDPANKLLALNSSLSALAVLAWPILIGAWYRRHWWAVVMGVVIVALLGVGDSTAPLAAFGFGAVAAFCVWRLPRCVYPIVGAVLAVAVIASPLLVKAMPDPETATTSYPFLPSSAVHRLMIWNATVGHIQERPLLGWGFETARTFSNKADAEETVLMRMPDGRLFHASSEPIPLHPHNAILQWWLELGVMGALLGAALLWSLIAGLRRLRPGGAAISFGVITTCLFMMAVSFGAWQSWWLSTLALGGLLTAAFLRALEAPQPECS